MNENNTRSDLFTSLQLLSAVIPEMRLGQLMAAIGELCADLHGRGLWDAEDAELLEAVWQFQRGFEPVTAGRDTVHPFLIETVRKNVAARHAITGFSQQMLNAARGVVTKVISMCAPKNLIDLRLELDIDGILGFFDDRIEHDEPAAVF